MKELDKYEKDIERQYYLKQIEDYKKSIQEL